jgi:hypothetical protein
MSSIALSLTVGLAVAALLLWATVTVVRRPRSARRKPGGLQMLGAVMLSFGEPFDPPSKHLAEAKSDKTGEADESGDPPVT